MVLEKTEWMLGANLSLYKKKIKRFPCFVSSLKMLSDSLQTAAALHCSCPSQFLGQNRDSVDTAHTRARHLDLTFKGDKWA